MASLNKVMIIGNVGNEPEMRFTPSGDSVTSFSVACNDSYTDKDGVKHESTEWFNVVAWKKLAEICNQFLVKGRQVYVEGKLKTKKWDSDDGQTHYKTELIAHTVLFIGEKKQVEQATEEEIEPEDLPF